MKKSLQGSFKTNWKRDAFALEIILNCLHHQHHHNINNFLPQIFLFCFVLPFLIHLPFRCQQNHPPWLIHEVYKPNRGNSCSCWLQRTMACYKVENFLSVNIFLKGDDPEHDRSFYAMSPRPFPLLQVAFCRF